MSNIIKTIYKVYHKPSQMWWTGRMESPSYIASGGSFDHSLGNFFTSSFDDSEASSSLNILFNQFLRLTSIKREFPRGLPEVEEKFTEFATRLRKECVVQQFRITYFGEMILPSE